MVGNQLLVLIFVLLSILENIQLISSTSRELEWVRYNGERPPQNAFTVEEEYPSDGEDKYLISKGICRRPVNLQQIPTESLQSLYCAVVFNKSDDSTFTSLDFNVLVNKPNVELRWKRMVDGKLPPNPIIDGYRLEDQKELFICQFRSSLDDGSFVEGIFTGYYDEPYCWGKRSGRTLGISFPSQISILSAETWPNKCNGKDRYDRLWEAETGETAIQPCPSGQYGKKSTWKCLYDSKFNGSSPDFRNCYSNWVHKIYILTSSQMKFNLSEGLQISTQLKENMLLVTSNACLDQMSSSIDIYGHEIWRLVKSSENIAEKVATKEMIYVEETTVKLTLTLLEVISLVLDYNRAWDQLEGMEKFATFSNTLDAIDNITLTLAHKECFEMQLENYTSCVNTFSFANIHKNAKAEVGVIGEEQTKVKLSEKGGEIKGIDTFIIVSVGEGNHSLYSGHIISTDLPNVLDGVDADENHYELNEDIVSLSFHNPNDTDASESGSDGLLADVTILHKNEAWGTSVQDVYRDIHVGESPKAVRGSAKCVYWDKKLLKFSTEGCGYVESSSFSSTCQCDHLSTFGLMMLFHRYRGKSIIIKVITFLCSGIFTMYCTCKIILYKRKEFYNDGDVIASETYTQTIKEFGFISSICCYVLVFYCVDKHYHLFNDLTCYRIGMLGHFLLLMIHISLTVQFSIAMIEYLQLKSVGYVIDATRKRPFVVLLGIPSAFSIISVSVTAVIDLYDGPNSVAYGGDFCWLNGGFIYHLFIPIWMLVFVNFAILGMLLYNFWDTNKTDEVVTLSGETLLKSEIKNFIQNGLLTNLLLFVTWLVGFFQLGEMYHGSQVLQYVFPCLFALQCYLLEMLANKKGCKYWIMLAINRIFCCKKSQSGTTGQKTLAASNVEENRKMLSKKFRVRRSHRGVQVGKPQIELNEKDSVSKTQDVSLSKEKPVRFNSIQEPNYMVLNKISSPN